MILTRTVVSPPGLQSSSQTIPGPERKEDPSIERALLEYLSGHCDLDGGAATPPREWIGDVDPSSLAFLKGLAEISSAAAPTATANAPTANTPTPNRLPLSGGAVGPPGAATAAAPGGTDPARPPRTADGPAQGIHRTSSASSGVSATTAREEHTKTWEVTVPPGVAPGEPFLVTARGIRVRVACPLNDEPGNRVRFQLPQSLFDQQNAREQPYKGASSDEFCAPPRQLHSVQQPWPLISASSQGLNDESPPKDDGMASGSIDTQRRMLSIIERQQAQMEEMRARLDALGGDDGRDGAGPAVPEGQAAR